MSTKPVVRRTYGKAPPRIPSSCSLFDEPSSPPTLLSNHRSSSPPSSLRLDTPPLHSSPPTPAKRPISRSTSPLFFSADEEEDQIIYNPSTSKDEAQNVLLKENDQKRVIKKLPTKKAIQSSLKGFFVQQPKSKTKAKAKPLEPLKLIPSSPSSSSKVSNINGILGIKSPKPTSSTKKSLTQLHLTHLPLLHTCSECGMSFMRGGDDESIHIAHHTRVLRGIVWDGLNKGKSKSSTTEENGWKLVKDDISFDNGKGKGKIVVVDASHGSNKLEEILSTVDRVLSSPPLPPPILDRCKVFLFITSSSPPAPKDNTSKRQKLDTSISKKVVQRDRVVGVVVAQGIKWAMKVLKDSEQLNLEPTSRIGEGKNVIDSKENKIVIESGGFGSVTCDPTSLPTPLGIHRLYISPSYRSNSLSIHLLNASCSNTIYGCSFDPLKGEIAFSQPTQSGRAIMEKWGKGNIRVFADDESQL
ncbi:uncharacterized protein L201_002598 [Kwoniella dendrophila CBS 6074]|uniref:N-acetyltransferase ESCO acetyl-transferase domain-containing protein n=1 Tax=Kwoniella dendrophila CBS 6074 TaxID=1295534 RepID=A0AAX4JQL2_9TREE